MAFRNPSPIPDDPHDPLDRPPDEDEAAPSPAPDDPEGWEEGEDERGTPGIHR